MSIRNVVKVMNFHSLIRVDKAKRQAELFEEELETKDRESYELKHDLITSQVRLENAEKEIALKMEQMEKLQKKIEELEKEFGGRLKK